MSRRLVALAAIAVLSGVPLGCAVESRREEQSRILRDTCASMVVRSAPTAWTRAAAAATADPARFALPMGQSADRRAVDPLIRRCLPHPD